LLPYHPRRLNKLLLNVDFEVSIIQKIRLYFAAWVIWIIMSAGHIYGTYLLKKDDLQQKKLKVETT
jgi:hypothetical protein